MQIVLQEKEKWEQIITAEAPWGVTGRVRTLAELQSLPASSIATDVSPLTNGVDDLYVSVIVESPTASPSETGLTEGGTSKQSHFA